MKKSIAFVAVAAFCFSSSNGGDDFQKYANYNPTAPESAPKFEEFSESVPMDSRVHTWWHWINGNVSKEGIKRDLDEMADKGYGGAVIFSLEGSIRGPVKFASPEWYDAFGYAAEVAAQNDMIIGAHNCDGWNEAGGPWVSVEDSMKTLTWTITQVDGGSERQLSLETPPHILDFYRDIAVIAWPALNSGKLKMFSEMDEIYPATEASVFAQDHPVTDMMKGHSKDLRHARIFSKDEALAPYGFTMKFQRPFDVGGVYIYVNPYRMRPQNIWLESSDDGKNFKKVKELNLSQTPVYCDFFNGGAAKYWRVVRYPDPNARGWDEHHSPLVLDIFEFELLAKGEASEQGSHINRLREKSAQVRSWMEVFSEDDRPIPQGALTKSKDIKVFRNAVGDDGVFKWNAPAGKWNVMRLGYTSTGKRNGPASDFGSGLEIDKFSKDALDRHFDAYAKKLVDAAGENAGKSFAIISTDSWECENQNWTEGFDEKFAELNGYDFLKWMPVFAGASVDSRAATENFLKDFRRTTSKLVNENFYGHMTARIHAEGLKYETEPSWDSYVMDQISTFKHADIPQDEIWSRPRDMNKIRTLSVENPVWPNNPLSSVFPYAPSAAHFYGKRQVSCESLTSWTGNWTDRPADLKETCNRILLSGYNTLVFHTYAHQPDERKPGWQMEPFGTALNRKLTWWPLSAPFFTYLNRVQYMLQKGRPDSRILALYADEIPAGGVKGAFPQNILTDVVNGEAVRDWLKFEDGKLESPGQMRYELLAVSPDSFLRLETLEKIKRLAEMGATVSGYYIGKYSTNVGGKKARAEWEKLNKELFGGPEKSVRKIGKGTVYANYSAEEAAAAIGMKASVVFADPDGDAKDVRWTKRLHDGGDEWFWIINGSAKDIEVVASFDCAGMKPYIWNAEDGTQTPVAAYSEAEGYTTMPLSVKPYADFFVVFKKESGASDSIVEYSVNGQSKFPEPAVKAESVSGNFTMAVTVSPTREIEIRGESQDGVFDSNQNFVIFPEGAHEKFGESHSGAGLSVGKNGIAVFEHGAFFKNIVLAAETEVAPNSRIAVVYENNAPAIYLNGKLLKKGAASRRAVHPSAVFKTGSDFENGRTEPFVFGAEEIEEDLNYKAHSANPRITAGKNGKYFAEFFGKGEVSARTSDGRELAAKTRAQISDTEIAPPFTVEFDENWGAPKSVVFDRLESWTENENEGVRHYSGIAVYKKNFDIEQGRLKKSVRAYLEFSNIMDVAEIIINGKIVGTLWKPPYVLDVTDFVREGENSIEIKVANTWANRCLYDATLPPEKRLTWSNTMGKLYPSEGDEVMSGIAWTNGPIPSGIIGNVKIVYSEVRELK